MLNCEGAEKCAWRTKRMMSMTEIKTTTLTAYSEEDGVVVTIEVPIPEGLDAEHEQHHVDELAGAFLQTLKSFNASPHQTNRCLAFISLGSGIKKGIETAALTDDMSAEEAELAMMIAVRTLL